MITLHCPKTLNSKLFAELEITVGHRTFSDHFMYLSEQNSLWLVVVSEQSTAHRERAQSRLRVYVHVYICDHICINHPYAKKKNRLADRVFLDVLSPRDKSSMADLTADFSRRIHKRTRTERKKRSLVIELH